MLFKALTLTGIFRPAVGYSDYSGDIIIGSGLGSGLGADWDFETTEAPSQGTTASQGTAAPPSVTCVPVKSWTPDVALKNCPDSQAPRDNDFSAYCCNCEDEEKFQDAMANQLYNDCAAPCLYKREDLGATAYEWDQEHMCYQEVTYSETCHESYVDHWNVAYEKMHNLCTGTPFQSRQGSTSSDTENSWEDGSEVAPEFDLRAYEDLGLGKCITKEGYVPSGRFLGGYPKDQCQRACDQRFNCAGYTVSDWDNCLLFIQPDIEKGNGVHWGKSDEDKCMRKILSENEDTKEWNMCHCDNPGSKQDGKNTITCAHSTDKCPEGSYCYADNKNLYGEWDKMCKPVSEDEKKCIRLEDVADEVCTTAWYNPRIFPWENMGPESGCQEQCERDPQCIGYQFHAWNSEEDESKGLYGNCDLIKFPCGGDEIKESVGNWNYVSKGCFVPYVAPPQEPQNELEAPAQETPAPEEAATTPPPFSDSDSEDA